MSDKPKKEDKERQKNLLPAHTTSLHRYMAEISNYPVLSREDEYELAMKYKNDGDLDAAKKLVSSNLKFVVSVANEYTRTTDLTLWTSYRKETWALCTR